MPLERARLGPNGWVGATHLRVWQLVAKLSFVPSVVIYTTKICSYCVRAKTLFARKGVAFSEVDVSEDDDKRLWLMKTTGQRTVPQIFINDQPVGGFDEVWALDRKGELDRLLNADSGA